MVLQPDKSDFGISMIKEVEAHEAINHWTLLKRIEVNNTHKNKHGKLKTMLSFFFQAQEISRFNINETQIQTLC